MRGPRSIVLACALAAVVAVGACSDSVLDDEPVPTTTSGLDAYADELFQRTNEVRTAEGLLALRESSCAESAALDRAAALVGEELTHAPLGPVIDACAPMTTAAENLVDSDAAPAEVVDAWMESPGHRANIVDPALTELGIGCVEHDDAHRLCAQIFLGP